MVRRATLMVQIAEQKKMHQTNQHFYDRIASFYDSIADSNEHVARERGEALLDVQQGWRVLEIGFGTGQHAGFTGKIGR